MPADHATAAPSSSYRWVNCSGSIELIRKTVEQGGNALTESETEDIDASKEGTAAHEFAEQWLRSEIITKLKGVKPQVGDRASNGYLLTHEMFDAVEMYAQHILGLKPIASFTRLEEMLVSVTEIGEHCWGTPDFIWYDHENKTVYVRDFKHGMGTVEVFENTQLMIYAILWYFGQLTERTLKLTFDLGIVQPRAFHSDGPIRTWQVSSDELLGVHFPVIKESYDRAFHFIDPQCSSGNWCRRCPGRLSCKAFTDDVYQALSYSEKATPLKVNAPDLAVEYTLLDVAAKQIKSRMEAVELQLEQYHKRGEVMPAVNFVQGKGRRAWKSETSVDQVAAIGSAFKIDLIKPKEAVTPTQAINKGINPEVIEALSEIPLRGLKIKPSDHKRARYIFSKKDPS